MPDYTFSQRLRFLREEKNIDQKELAKILKLANSTISQYETGDRVPNDSIKINIADFFNVSLDYLLGRTNIRNIDVKKAPNETLVEIAEILNNSTIPQSEKDDLYQKFTQIYFSAKNRE